MADYDPKSIPILDDVIDEVLDDAADKDRDTNLDNKKTGVELAENESDAEDSAADDNFDLFNSKATDSTTDKQESESFESALIDYQLEDETAEVDEKGVIDNPTETQPASDIQIIDTAPAIDIDEIVDDVVKQMMPDLEQQLRFLIQQALEEKLDK